MGINGFYIVGTIGFAFIAYLLMTGGLRMHSKSSSDRLPGCGRFESIVAIVMFTAAVLAICSICIVVLTWVTS